MTAKRVLLIRPGGIGDCILHFPKMERLCGDYTEVWVPREVAGLVRFASQVRALAGTGLDWVGLPGIEPPRGVMDHLASFDEIHTWYGSSREEFRAALAALPVAYYPPHDPGEGVPRIPVDAERHGAVILHPFSSNRNKNWPLENFRALARLLERERGARVEWTAGPRESLDGARRFDSLPEFAVWVAGAAAYVGNDTGTTHLAAAVGTPVVALFQSTDPCVWAPRGNQVTIFNQPTLTNVYQTVAGLIDFQK